MTTQIIDTRGGASLPYFEDADSLLYFFDIPFSLERPFGIGRSDGTSEGTQLLAETTSITPAEGLIGIGDKLFFSANENNLGEEL